MDEDRDGLQPANENDLLMQPFVPMQAQVPEQTDEEDDFTEEIDTEFDPRYREPFVGLLHLGYLAENFNLYGHKFRIKTPTQRERLEGGLLHKPYINSLSAEIAWATITTAMYLESVDDESLPQPIGPADTGVEDRFNWVQKNLRPEVVDRVFEKCLILDSRVNETLQKLEDSAKN